MGGRAEFPGALSDRYLVRVPGEPHVGLDIWRRPKKTGLLKGGGSVTALPDSAPPPTRALEVRWLFRFLPFLPDLPVLLSSDYSEEDLSIKSNQENQPDGFLTKLLQLSDIKATLQKILS
ncbi:MAG: hypothetical protein KAR01_03400 [Desulfocapsa sp.]|nr:hypothetical protein [Desulfocapsa sp.]